MQGLEAIETPSLSYALMWLNDYVLIRKPQKKP